jgi:ammonia channel protein AmtB
MSTGLSLAIVSTQWFIFGFSLSFSETGGIFNGDFGILCLDKVWSMLETFK